MEMWWSRLTATAASWWVVGKGGAVGQEAARIVRVAVAMGMGCWAPACDGRRVVESLQISASGGRQQQHLYRYRGMCVQACFVANCSCRC